MKIKKTAIAALVVLTLGLTLTAEGCDTDTRKGDGTGQERWTPPPGGTLQEGE